jgi:hypothetical protein
MRLHRIRIEGRADIDWPPRNLLETLIHTFGTPNGPTYVMLFGPDEEYVQAAGSAGPFVLEARDQYGEGFLHLRAGTMTGSTTTIGYRWTCPKGVHPPNGCPHEVDAGCVLDLNVVKATLLHYARTGSRYPGIVWNDVTSEYLCLAKDDGEIRDVRPIRAAS